MNHIVLIAAIGLLSTTTVFAQTASAPLIVVEDRGGASALPYYQAAESAAGSGHAAGPDASALASATRPTPKPPCCRCARRNCRRATCRAASSGRRA